MEEAHAAAPDVRPDARRNAVFIVSDDRILPAARFLWWTLKRLNPRADTDIILVAPEGVRRVLEQTARPGESLSLGDVPMPDLDFHTPGYLTRATYSRLGVPRLLQPRYRRLLYLDVDTFPLDPRLFGLFDLAMPTPIAAALDFDPNINASKIIDGTVRVGPFAFDRYMNTGVMLIDTDAWVAANIDERTYVVIGRHGDDLRHADQTALNVAAPDAFCLLSRAFNFRPHDRGTILEERFPPSIMHFNGGTKPWRRPNRFHSPHTRELRAFLWRTGEFRFLWRTTIVRDFLNKRMRGDRRKRPPRYVRMDNPHLAALLTLAYVDEADGGNNQSGSSS